MYKGIAMYYMVLREKNTQSPIKPITQLSVCLDSPGYMYIWAWPIVCNSFHKLEHDFCTIMNRSPTCHPGGNGSWAPGCFPWLFQVVKLNRGSCTISKHPVQQWCIFPTLGDVHAGADPWIWGYLMGGLIQGQIESLTSYDHHGRWGWPAVELTQADYFQRITWTSDGPQAVSNPIRVFPRPKVRTKMVILSIAASIFCVVFVLTRAQNHIFDG